MLLSDFCSNVLHVLFNNGFRFKPSRFGGESTGSKAWGLGSFNDSLITPMQSYYGESFAGQSSMPEFYYPNIKSYLSVAMQQIWWNDETVKFSDINSNLDKSFLLYQKKKQLHATDKNNTTASQNVKSMVIFLVMKKSFH